MGGSSDQRGRGDRGRGGRGGMSTDTIDRVETERMILERLRLEHGPEQLRLLLDPRVNATLWPRDQTPTEAEVIDGLAAKVKHWDRHGFGMWLLRGGGAGGVGCPGGPPF